MQVASKLIFRIKNKVFRIVVSFTYQTFAFRNPSMAADGTWTSNYWPLHTPVKREVLVLNGEHQGQLEGLRVRKCAFWKNFLPKLLSMSK